MGQALWRLPPRQQQQLQEELANRLADRGERGRREQGRKLLRLLAVSFGLLCFLQAALNISLRLVHFESLSSCKTSAQEESCKNKTKANLKNFEDYFQQGWVYFHPSLYFISIIRKSWHESRNYCLERGADLMIINNQKEQDFTRRFVGYTWIGLKRTENKEEWRWVDGTPLTKSYWIPGEPNNNGGKEDCVHLKFHGREKSWNDISCDVKNFWICEKMVVC
ncbi:CD209 antigen-like protein E isoform X2 [Cheilinus undulatus]|uniref:CD209 antigen-like protein E isoform X2 n=1 Tax=Cheilinus undulatus TaxID=241271 RepID=UPI001BD3636B|nr:CD209 antigen-like protein E isoform X2 [Cheilinus undulatus]XP_041641992.1 CD209 antigen-like protein E isoform X2 [Cheilinus undulatus]